MNFLVTIVELFIFPVGLIICLIIPSVTSFLGKVVSLRLTISGNGCLGVMGLKIQSIMLSLWVYFILGSVVVIYITFKFDMLSSTLL